MAAGCWLTCKGEHWGEDNMDSSTVDIKHDPKVDSYAAQHSKAVHKGPVRGIQRDLMREKETIKARISLTHKKVNTWIYIF